MKKIIKISCADSSRSRADNSNPMIFKFLPNKKNIWRDCEFFWNDESINKADYWVIIGDVDLDEEACEVSKDNVILMTGEPQSIKRYDVYEGFTNQFGRIYTSHQDFKHPKTFPCRPPINWWIDAGSPIKSPEEFQQWQGEGLSYDDFKNLNEVSKQKLLSVFCSDKTFTEGHKARFNFCQKLKNHFGDQIDWFGNGVRPIDNKWDGIAPYKYHIVLENFNNPDYWTEKLIDPLMVLTYPIYFGAINIDEYFPNQITEIDIKYPRFAIAKIEKLIAENAYEKRSQQLLQMRNLVMDEYNLFNLIYKITLSDQTSSNKNSPQLIKIKKEKFFILQTSLSLTKSRKNLARRIRDSIAKKIRKTENLFIDYFLLIKLKLKKI